MGRRARVSREEVLSAAREAFAQQGYHGTTLSQIAGRVGVSPAALLRHAAGKRELFAAAMAPASLPDPFALDFLRAADPAADPVPVLRRLAQTAIPFIEREMGENIARWLFTNSAEQVAQARRIGQGLRGPASPPRRVFAVLEDYLRRARRAGRIRIADSTSAALAFMGGLNAYVFFHRVLRLVDPPVPLERYVDTLLEVWTAGAIRPPASRRRSADGRRRRGVRARKA